VGPQGVECKEYVIRRRTDRRGMLGIRRSACAGSVPRRCHLRQRARGSGGVDQRARRRVAVLLAGAQADQSPGNSGFPWFLRVGALEGGASARRDPPGAAGDQLRGSRKFAFRAGPMPITPTGCIMAPHGQALRIGVQPIYRYHRESSHLGETFFSQLLST